jgi:SAM-dependent methyltransferase
MSDLVARAVVPTSSYTLADQERMARAKNYFAWHQRLVTKELGQRVLDLGCGIGNFTSALLDRELVVAVDLEPDCIERLRERYPRQHNLHALVGDASCLRIRDLAQLRLDSCVCLNVLEHIKDDVAIVRSLASFLKPGAAIVLLLPAFPVLYGPIDTNLGHYRRYTRRSVRALASAAGVRVKRARYLNTVGFFGWWFNARVLRREAQSGRQIEFFDRYIVPVLSRVEQIVPPPFGQSLFVVLET